MIIDLFYSIIGGIFDAIDFILNIPSKYRRYKRRKDRRKRKELQKKFEESFDVKKK